MAVLNANARGALNKGASFGAFFAAFSRVIGVLLAAFSRIVPAILSA